MPCRMGSFQKVHRRKGGTNDKPFRELRSHFVAARKTERRARVTAANLNFQDWSFSFQHALETSIHPTRA